MKRQTIENILNFLNEKEDKELPQKWFYSIKKIELVKELENHPDGIQYKHKGDLNLKNSNITKLPNDLYVDGRLNLRYCDQLTKLPDKLYVGGWLDIRGCNQLTELPNNLYVGGNLWLYVSKIQEIPDNLYVGGYLHISETPLSKKYSHEEIREIITSKGGTLIGKIFRL